MVGRWRAWHDNLASELTQLMTHSNPLPVSYLDMNPPPDVG